MHFKSIIFSAIIATVSSAPVNTKSFSRRDDDEHRHCVTVGAATAVVPAVASSYEVAPTSNESDPLADITLFLKVWPHVELDDRGVEECQNDEGESEDVEETGEMKAFSELEDRSEPEVAEKHRGHIRCLAPAAQTEAD
ncbi:hypothetical protein ColTof3_11245 [Colletotrichum tofieldiae]|nr:hypothetical protein ColTof3_11245 [Colletotrichum tofieldiae]